MEQQETKAAQVHGDAPADVPQAPEQGAVADLPEEDAKISRLGTASLGALLLEFAIPSVFSTVLTALYNVIDSIFLGQAMGEIGLAATTVASPVMTIMMALAVLAGAGGNALAAIILGRGDHDRAEKTLGNTMFLMIAFAIPVALLATFCIDPLLILVGATDVTLPYAHRFVQIVSYGFLLNNIAYGISNFMRTSGAPWQALGVGALGTVVCIVLNALFVLYLGWGVVGSALATICGQGASSVWVLWFFIFNKKAPLHLRVRYLVPEGKLCLKIMSLGIAPCALQAAAAITQVAGNNVMATLGAGDAIGTDGALASLGVVVKIIMFAVFPAVGIATGAQPILGFNVGARKHARVKRTLYLAIASAFVVLLCFFISFHVVPRAIIGLFGVEDELMDFSVQALKIATAIVPLSCVQTITSNYFQSTGQPTKSMLLSLTRQILYLLPMYYIVPKVLPMLVPSLTPLVSFCFAFPVADFLAFVTCSIFLMFEIRRLNGLIREEDERSHG